MSRLLAGIASLLAFAFVFVFVTGGAAQPPAPARASAAPRGFRIEEATIAGVQRALREHRLTCRALVQFYLDRIEALDKRGPALNAIVTTHPDALARAAELDARMARGETLGPLHCVPVIVKDNYDTFDLPTTAGSLSLKDFVPGVDAFLVKRVREAGAIVLAKSNMAEFAFSPYETVGSRLPGYTRNPYALSRVTAGSSGGTAAAVAANMGLVGLGTDTGNSIRGPSAHQSLVGIRPTMGLTSRAGIVPLNLAADIGGPMTRTVEDAARVLEAIEGPDPDDPVTTTAAAKAHTHAPYLDALRAVDALRTGNGPRTPTAAAAGPNASERSAPDSRAVGRPTSGARAASGAQLLAGARIGVLRWITRSETADPAVLALFGRALRELTAAGATVVDPLELPGLDDLRRSSRGGCEQFKFDLNTYLARFGDRVPVKTLADIIKSRRFHPSIEVRLEAGQRAEIAPDANPACQARDEFRQKLRDLVVQAMDDARLDALVYPTWNNRPRLIGDLNTPHGDNNQLFAPSTGFPAITVPMGYVEDTLPSGLQFLGRAWSESTLFRLAYAYEQSTHYRRPPPLNGHN